MGGGETCWEYANGQKIYGYEKKSSWGCLSLTRGYIHVYDHNIQTSSSLKALGQSLSGALLGKGSEN